jgi:hypothetical protein
MTLTPSQTLNPKPYTLHPKPEKKMAFIGVHPLGLTGTKRARLHAHTLGVPRRWSNHSTHNPWFHEHHTHILCSHEPGRATSSDPSGSMRWQGCRTPAGGEYTLANWQHSTISLPSLSLWLLLTLSILMLLSSSSSLLLLLFVNVTITHYH